MPDIWASKSLVPTLQWQPRHDYLDSSLLQNLRTAKQLFGHWLLLTYVDFSFKLNVTE